MRLQRGAYFGNNLQEIRRTSDSSLINIGHDANGEIDIAAAIAHAGNINRMIWSQDFTHASWSKIAGATIVSTNNLAPDSTSTATIFNSTGFSVLQQTESVQISLIPSTNIINPTGNYCYSAYVKFVNNNGIRLSNTLLNRIYSFDFSAPAANPSVGGNFEALSNGWYRIWMTFTGAQIASEGFRIQANSATNGAQYLVWGAQLNPGTTPTTYVPTLANPSGFARVRTYFDHSSNARHAVASQTAREDFIVVEGQAIYENGELVTARYESTHGGAGGYVVSTVAMGANTTTYSKIRRLTGQYVANSGIYEHNSNGTGFSDPSTYNSSISSNSNYKVDVFNRAIPNGQVFRRLISDNSWTAGTLLTNLAATNPNLTQIRGEFFSTWGRVAIRGDVIFNASHDLSTMQAISLLM